MQSPRSLTKFLPSDRNKILPLGSHYDSPDGSLYDKNLKTLFLSVMLRSSDRDSGRRPEKKLWRRPPRGALLSCDRVRPVWPIFKVLFLYFIDQVSI